MSTGHPVNTLHWNQWSMIGHWLGSPAWWPVQLQCILGSFKTLHKGWMLFHEIFSFQLSSFQTPAIFPINFVHLWWTSWTNLFQLCTKIRFLSHPLMLYRLNSHCETYIGIYNSTSKIDWSVINKDLYWNLQFNQ